MAQDNDFLLEDAEDDVKTIEYIKDYLPQDLKNKFSEEDLYYIVDVITDYYANSGILDQKPDKDGYIAIDQDAIVAYILAAAEKDGMGPYEADDVFFVVQGEAEYAEKSEE
ncbi:hypothetical protein [Phocaeicola abscessus]|uniref:hypothetical protein n=1 Tax=Phocaeicola abscessus TaxID=555313 RepID=UPI000385941E|nr:hypothetical protein [Phocaeicola abscessus]EPT33633.1 hypothetical protein HMPREF9012_0453 [Bacteroidetes bacterium oral taxon 272 str. F0290]